MVHGNADKMHAITCALFLWMHLLTFVHSQDCALEQFVNGPKYDSNFDITDLDANYPGGKQVRVRCNVGYTGFFKLICVEGKWQARGSKCQLKSCGHPGDAQFADFYLEEGDDFVFGSKVVYTCHRGYQMVSRTNFRRCMAEGWDGVVPVCSACSKLPDVPHANVTEETRKAEYQEGDVIHFACEPGYISDHTSKYVCTDQGWLAVRRGMCYSCSKLPDVPHANVTEETRKAEYQEGDMIHFACEPGYASDLTIKYVCASEGWLAIRQGLCYKIKCAAPVIENGFVPGDIQEYKEHEVLNFQCNPQYKRAEDRQSKCIKVGTKVEWSPTPVCEEIKCELKLPALEGTRYEPASRNVFSPGDTVRVLCGEKHWIMNHQSTSAETTCQSDGRWSIRPLCQEVICSNERDPLVDSWGVYWYDQKKLGDSAYYRCRRGYQSTNRANQATCTRDGWAPNPLCRAPTGCGTPPPLEDGDTKETIQFMYRHNTKVEYVCQNYYLMEGVPYMTCNNGEWTGQMRCLKPCTVDKDAMTRHNIRFRNRYDDKLYSTHSDSITFSCTYGTNPVGTLGMRQKCIDGVIDLPNCQ